MPTINSDLLPAFLFRFDGNNFRRILDEGYFHDPEKRSLVAFFPLYPMSAKLLSLCGVERQWALIVVSQVSLVVGLFTFRRYMQALNPGNSENSENSFRVDFACILVFAFPMHLFYFAAYSEPMFFLLACLVFLGMRAGWSPWRVALIAGLATACRSVGVAFCPAVFWYAWHYSSPLPLGEGPGVREEGGGIVQKGSEVSESAVIPVPSPQPSPIGRGGRMIGLALLSLSGIMAYMLYQYSAFGTPFAFAQTQQHWRSVPAAPWGEKIVSLAILEPVWRAFDSGSPRYIFRFDRSGNPFSNAVLWHIILWLLAGVLLVVGYRKKEITTPEAIAWLGLWLIPYLTRGHEMAMHSQGRFVSVIVPMYLVLANRLLNMPEIARWGIIILFIFVQILLTMQFAVGRLVI